MGSCVSKNEDHDIGHQQTEHAVAPDKDVAKEGTSSLAEEVSRF